MTFTSIIGIAAGVILLVEFVPQPFRILRTRSISGISTVGSGIAFGSEIGWLVFGIVEGITVVVVTAVVTAVLTLTQFVLVWPHRRPTDVWWVGLWASVLVVAVALGSLGSVLVISVVVSLGPQVWTAWLSPNVDGISPARWLLGGVSGLLWGTYGILIGQLTLVGSGGVALFCAAAVLARLGAGHLGWFPRDGGDEPGRVAPHTPKGIK